MRRDLISSRTNGCPILKTTSDGTLETNPSCEFFWKYVSEIPLSCFVILGREQSSGPAYNTSNGPSRQLHQGQHGRELWVPDTDRGLKVTGKRPLSNWRCFLCERRNVFQKTSCLLKKHLGWLENLHRFSDPVRVDSPASTTYFQASRDQANTFCVLTPRVQKSQPGIHKSTNTHCQFNSHYFAHVLGWTLGSSRMTLWWAPGKAKRITDIFNSQNSPAILLFAVLTLH